MKNNDQLSKKDASSQIDEEKRDFLFITTTGLAIAGGGAFAWSMIDTMNPSKDVLALSTTEVDLSPLEEGQSLTVMWRGKPIFIRRRTDREINEAQTVKLSDLNLRKLASLPDESEDEFDPIAEEEDLL